MGFVEISDGTMNRRQQIQGLQGTIRIDVSGDGETTIIVPDTCSIEQSPAADTRASPEE